MMASFRYTSPPPTHFSLQYSSVHRPGLVRGLSRGTELFHKPELPRPVTVVTTPGTKPPGELTKEKTIREKLLNPEPPQPSSYDTAWVAMVPAPGCAQASRFPQCVDWIMQNQRGDGSWGLGVVDDGSHELSLSLAKDALSSTLACVLALKTWGVGDELVSKGLRFIRDNLSSVTDGHQGDKPVGFKVIFSGMLARCIAIGLEVPITQTEMDAIFQMRNKELYSLASGSKAFKAYVAEGLGSLHNWDEAAMAFQRKNGSFFDSPATTAAAVIHSSNGRALQYLESLVSMFGSSVPTVYPRDLYTRMRMVDTLQKTGISRSFTDEINHILDLTYMSWVAKDEEIMLDMSTCALTFRLLRMQGYDVSSEGLAQFCEESSFHNSIQGCLNDTVALLELHKASQVQILEQEKILENLRSWSAKLLKQQLCSNKISRSIDPNQVEHVLKYPFYTRIDGQEHRRNIEHFEPVGIQMLKSAYRTCLPDAEIVSLAADDFHSSQTLYQEEIQYIKRWVQDMRLDELEFARLMPLISHMPPASTMLGSDLSEARTIFSQNSILVTVLDDLFDVGGSTEEMENLVKLIEMWDAHDQVGFCSEHVEIVFHAIYDTSNKMAAKAAEVQNRSVIRHLAEMWANTVRAMMAEANWRIRGIEPSYKEYMVAGELSIGVGPSIIASLYMLGPELPEDVVTSQEYNDMFRHMNVCCRLLNDVQSHEREKKQGKINSVLLLARQGCESIEAAEVEVKRAIETSRMELLRLVVNKESAVPLPCRQLFWNMCKVAHGLFIEVDGYASPKEMMHAAKEVLLHPLRFPAGKSDAPPRRTK